MSLILLLQPRDPCVEITECGTEVVTSLDGYTFSDDAFDSQACFDLIAEDYIGNGLILSQILGRWETVGLCGNTGLGLYYYGCSGGSVTNQGDYIPTTDDVSGKVVAQVCSLQCLDYILDPTLSPIVLMAQIGSQWFIINVVDRPSTLTTKDGSITTVCADACCGIGFKYIEVTIGTGCGALSGQVFNLIGAGGSWSGQVTAGGDTFLMSISCSIGTAAAEDWSVNGGCGSAVAADDFTILCDTNSMSGTADFSSMTCGLCSSVSVSFQSIEIPDKPCETTTLTGVEVIMEACGVPPLAIGDRVIMAEVPKLGSACSTGTGTGTATEPQWQMIQACSDQIECGDDCDPPPPEDAECCDWTTVEIPENLVGTIAVSSDLGECECSGTVVFGRTGDAIPPVWTQTDSADCEADPYTGTGVANALTAMSGMVISCQGVTTGTGTGTAALGEFSLDINGSCSGAAPAYEAGGSCDPMLVEWSGIDISGCCTGGVPSPSTVTMTLEVTEA